MTDPAPYIAAYYRKQNGYKPDPDFVDYLTAFTNDATLVSAARDEVDRLTPIAAARPEDYITKMTLKSLTEMLAAFDKPPPPP